MSAQLADQTRYEKPEPVFTKFLKANPDLSESNLRYQIRCRHANGLSNAGALVKVGKAWWIFPSKYYAWLSDRAFQA
jgi:hypothetical protein